MKEYKIYTAGKMAGLSFGEMMDWREKIHKLIKMKADSKIKFIHPPNYFLPGYYPKENEGKVKEWDINQVRNSDIVIVNLDGVNSSAGTHFELSMVDAINSMTDRHIFVVSVGEEENGLHPWIADSIHYRAKSFEDAAEYIVTYLLE